MTGMPFAVRVYAWGIAVATLITAASIHLGGKAAEPREDDDPETAGDRADLRRDLRAIAEQPYGALGAPLLVGVLWPAAVCVLVLGYLRGES